MMEQVLAEPSAKATVEPVHRFVRNPSLIAYPEPVRISLILPFYNEGMILLDNVRNLTKTLNRLGLVSEMLLCDDNSNDGARHAAALASSDSVFYLRFSERIGKGGTIKNALNAARGEIIVILNADI